MRTTARFTAWCCFYERRVARQHSHRVINRIVSVRRHAIRFVCQTFERPLEFFTITGERLNRLHVHPKSHERENGRMIGELAREFAHRITNSRRLFGVMLPETSIANTMATGAASLRPFQVESGDGTFDAVFEKFEVFLSEVAHQVTFESSATMSSGQIRIDLDYILRVVLSRQRATRRSCVDVGFCCAKVVSASHNDSDAPMILPAMWKGGT
jgi:hypothetical protein